MDDYKLILSNYWGYSSFRFLQDEIIASIGSGLDTLGLMPTGGGKSITFQVPAMAKPGLCLVITPLVALMKDQVENLRRKGIKAVCIHSQMSRSEILSTLDNCIYGNFKFLYVSPERLSNEQLLLRLPHFNINMIAVDEAHCISQWGYDFRPAFMRIKELRQHLPLVPILALTATATPEVVEDIQLQLQFKKNNVFKKSFERKNLIYLVRQVEDKLSYLLRILNKEQGTAIVYTRSKAKTKEISQFLKQNNISSSFFHAGISDLAKDEAQFKWMQGESRVIVATNAFGMGIDKPNVRVVIHVDVPDSIEAYFQEAGRAGRDGEKAYAVLLYQKNDISLLKRRVKDTYPETDFVRKVYNILGSYFQVPLGFGLNSRHSFDLQQFCTIYKLNRTHVHSAVKILQLEGYVDYMEEGSAQSLIQFMQSRDSLYHLHLDNPSLDHLLKCILRSYAGVFSQLTAIDEEYLEAKVGMNANEIYHALVYLSKLGVLQYIPKRGTASIVYTMDRMEGQYLLFRTQNYQKRKDGYTKRVQAVVGYLTNNTLCRSSYLLSYFGESNSCACGECDVCKSANKLPTSSLSEELITLLRTSKQSVHQLEAHFLHREEELKQVIRQMMERQQIRLQGIWIVLQD